MQSFTYKGLNFTVKGPIRSKGMRYEFVISQDHDAYVVKVENGEEDGAIHLVVEQPNINVLGRHYMDWQTERTLEGE